MWCAADAASSHYCAGLKCKCGLALLWAWVPSILASVATAAWGAGMMTAQQTPVLKQRPGLETQEAGRWQAGWGHPGPAGPAAGWAQLSEVRREGTFSPQLLSPLEAARGSPASVRTRKPSRLAGEQSRNRAVVRSCVSLGLRSSYWVPGHRAAQLTTLERPGLSIPRQTKHIPFYFFFVLFMVNIKVCCFITGKRINWAKYVKCLGRCLTLMCEVLAFNPALPI